MAPRTTLAAGGQAAAPSPTISVPRLGLAPNVLRPTTSAVRDGRTDLEHNVRNGQAPLTDALSAVQRNREGGVSPYDGTATRPMISSRRQTPLQRDRASMAMQRNRGTSVVSPGATIVSIERILGAEHPERIVSLAVAVAHHAQHVTVQSRHSVTFHPYHARIQQMRTRVVRRLNEVLRRSQAHAASSGSIRNAHLATVARLIVTRHTSISRDRAAHRLSAVGLPRRLPLARPLVRRIAHASALAHRARRVLFPILRLGVAHTSATDCTVPGMITGNVELTAGGCIVYTSGGTTVGSLGTLTVDAGVTVQVGGGLDVQGTLTVRGTADQPVVFTSASKNPAPGDWFGVRYEAGSAGTMSYAIVNYAGNGGCWAVCGSYAGVSFNGQSTAGVDHLTVWNSASNGLRTTGGATPGVTNSTFLNNAGVAIELDTPNALVGIANNAFSGNAATGNGVYLDGGVLTQQATLSSADDGSVRLAGNTQVGSTGSLTVTAGTTVFSSAGLDVLGTLTVQGTVSQPVLFTSSAVSPAPGDWFGIRYEAGSAGSVSHATIADAGNGGCWYVCGAYAAISVNGPSTVSVDHVTIQKSASNGLRTTGGAIPSITSDTFLNNAGVAIELGDPNALTGLAGNTFADNQPIYGNGVYLDGGTLTLQTTLSPSDDGVVRLAGNTQVGSTGGLVIDPGTTVLGNAGLDVLGTLTVQGTATQPVTFTSAAVSPAPGDWYGIRYEAGSSGGMSYATVADAGNGGCWYVCGAYAAISVNGQSAAGVDHVTVHDSASNGLRATGGATPGVTNSTFVNNAWVAVELDTPNALTGLSNNIFAGNTPTGNGVYLDGGTLTQQASVAPADDGSVRLAGNVQVGSTAALTVAAGTTLFGNGGLDVLGALTVQGTAAQPVAFTSAAASPAPGDWPGVRYEAGSSGGLFYTSVDDAGSAGYYAGVSFNGPSSAGVDHLTVQHSYYHGLRTTNGALPSVTNSAFINNRGVGIELGDPNALTGLVSNTFVGNEAIDGNGVYLDGGTLTQQTTVSPADDGRVRLGGNVQIASAGGLIVKPGTTILGNGGLDVFGTLTAQGTTSQPITFTSASANPQPGDWPGVRYEAGSTGGLFYTSVDDAGAAGYYADISVNGQSAASLDHVTAQHSRYHGLRTTGGATPAVTNSTFSNNVGLGIELGDPNALTGLANNTFAGNEAIDGNGVYLDGGLLTRQATLSSAANGTVRLGGNVQVGSTGGLTVTAGETVLGNGGLDVLGALTVQGTTGQPVIFTSASASPSPGDWPGIRYEANSTGGLVYTFVSYAGAAGYYAGVSFNGPSSAGVDHLTV